MLKPCLSLMDTVVLVIQQVTHSFSKHLEPARLSSLDVSLVMFWPSCRIPHLGNTQASLLLFSFHLHQVYLLFFVCLGFPKQ